MKVNTEESILVQRFYKNTENSKAKNIPSYIKTPQKPHIFNQISSLKGIE